MCYLFTHLFQKSRPYDVWFLRYEVHQTEFFVILGHFLPLYPPNSRKNENVKNEKKSLEISLFYRSVPKLMIIGYTVLEIWQVTDVTVVFYYG